MILKMKRGILERKLLILTIVEENKKGEDISSKIYMTKKTISKMKIKKLSINNHKRWPIEMVCQ